MTRTVPSQETLQKAADAKLRMLQHLPDDGDLSLIVLKGHLLIEELLLALVQAQVKHPAAIESAKLSFHTLTCLAKALCFEERFKDLWEAMFKLNALRNSLAHNLESPEHEKRLRAFALAVSGGDKRAEDHIAKEPRTTMINSISVICGFLIGLSFRLSAS